MVGLVVGGATPSAGADLIDCQMPATEAAWYAAAGSGVTNLAFDHDMSVIGNYYWDSHGIRFGATGGGFGPSAGYDVGFYTPAGWSLLFHEPHGSDTRDLRLTFATPQRAISFNNIAWTNMEPAPSGGSGPRTFIHTEFFFQGTQIGSWELNQGWFEGVPFPQLTHTFLGFVNDTAFDEVRMGIFPQYGGTYHYDTLALGFHGVSFSTVPAPGALSLLGVCGVWPRRRTRSR